MRDVDLDRRVLGLESTRAMMLHTPTVPICTDRTLSFLRKDRDMRHLRHLGNPDIADYPAPSCIAMSDVIPRPSFPSSSSTTALLLIGKPSLNWDVLLNLKSRKGVNAVSRTTAFSPEPIVFASLHDVLSNDRPNTKLGMKRLSLKVPLYSGSSGISVGNRSD